MAVAIPDAFGSRGLLFAGSYVAIQVGRHLFLTFASARPGTIERERALAILVWFSVAGAFWIAGALVEDEARVALWLVALAIDYLAPVFLYRVPGRPQLAPETWDVETAHFAERFQLFVIIALGESIVLIGATTADLDIDAARLTALGTRVRRHGRALVAVLRLRGADRATPSRADGEPHAAGARRLHVPPRLHDRGHHRVGGRRRAGHRSSHGCAARGRGRGARVRAGDLPARARAVPPAHGRDAVAKAAGGRARLSCSGRARPGRPWSRALGAARRRGRRRDRRGAYRRVSETGTRRAVAARAAGIRAARAATLRDEGGVVEGRTARSGTRSRCSPRHHGHQRAAGHDLPRRLVLRDPLQLQPSQQRRSDRPRGVTGPLAQPHVHRQHDRARVHDAGDAARWRDDMRAPRRRLDLLDPDALRRRRADHPAGRASSTTSSTRTSVSSHCPKD